MDQYTDPACGVYMSCCGRKGSDSASAFGVFCSWCAYARNISRDLWLVEVHAHLIPFYLRYIRTMLTWRQRCYHQDTGYKINTRGLRYALNRIIQLTLKGQYRHDQGVESECHNHCCCLNESVIFSLCVHLKLGHRFHALLKVCSYPAYIVPLTKFASFNVEPFHGH